MSLTDGQVKYLESIADHQRVVVKPWNPKGLEVANKIMTEIKAVEPGLEIMLLGSLPLKIAGQEDIDISAFCIKAEQERHFNNFCKLFGEPLRVGKTSTAWEFGREGFHVSVWLTDPTAETTQLQIRVFQLLQSNPELLREYADLKEGAKNLPYKEYQRKKYEFFNRICSLE